MTRDLVALNEDGFRIGEDHQRAKFTDHEIELMRQMHQEDGVGVQEIAAKFEASKGYVSKVVRYKLRAQRPDRWKRTNK